MTKGPERCSSIQSSSGMPTTAAGMQATTILAQSDHVPRRSSGVLDGAKGFSCRKYSTHTARMAPSWMTTRNMFQKSSETSSDTNWSRSSMCPVEEMGSHSVTPSTRPNSAALSNSTMSTLTP